MPWNSKSLKLWKFSRTTCHQKERHPLQQLETSTKVTSQWLWVTRTALGSLFATDDAEKTYPRVKRTQRMHTIKLRVNPGLKIHYGMIPVNQAMCTVNTGCTGIANQNGTMAMMTPVSHGILNKNRKRTLLTTATRDVIIMIIMTIVGPIGLGNLTFNIVGPIGLEIRTTVLKQVPAIIVAFQITLATNVTFPTRLLVEHVVK